MNSVNYVLPLVISLLIQFRSALILQAQPIAQHSLEQRVSFANGCYELGEYATAAREYRWLLANSSLDADSLHWILARCAFHLDDLHVARTHVEAISPQTSFRYYASLGKAWLSFTQNTTQASRPFIPDLHPSFSGASNEIYDSYWVVALADIADQKNWQALDTFRPVRPIVSPLARQAVSRIYSLAETHRYRRPRSPGIAGALSVIPGGGLAYLGRWAQAGTIFLAIVGLGLQSREGFYRGTPWLGWSFLTLGVGTWSLSIFNSVLQARLANQVDHERYSRYLRAEVDAVVRPALAP